MKYRCQTWLSSPEDMTQMSIDARYKSEIKEKQPVDLKQLYEKKRIILDIHEVYDHTCRKIDFD